MTGIKKRVGLFAIVSGIGSVVSIWLLLSIRQLHHLKSAETFLFLLISMTFITTTLFIQEYKKLRIAQVIMENQIVHIPAARSSEAKRVHKMPSFMKRRDITVSNFGILMDSKIIMFNQEDIQLKAVEVGRDFISITYGTALNTQTMKLVHPKFDNWEINKVAEKFRFETGIVPQIVK